jgi:hypothetical protein
MDNKQTTFFDKTEDSVGLEDKSFRAQVKMWHLNWPLGLGHCMQQGKN